MSDKAPTEKTPRAPRYGEACPTCGKLNNELADGSSWARDPRPGLFSWPATPEYTIPDAQRPKVWP